MRPTEKSMRRRGVADVSEGTHVGGVRRLSGRAETGGLTAIWTRWHSCSRKLHFCASARHIILFTEIRLPSFLSFFQPRAESRLLRSWLVQHKSWPKKLRALAECIIAGFPSLSVIETARVRPAITNVSTTTVRTVRYILGLSKGLLFTFMAV